MTTKILRAFAPVLLSWTLLGQGGFTGPGRYEILNLKSGRVLDLDRNDQTTVIQFAPRGTDNQTWDIRPAGVRWAYPRRISTLRRLVASPSSGTSTPSSWSE